MKKPRCLKIWVSQEILLMAIYRGPHRPGLNGRYLRTWATRATNATKQPRRAEDATEADRQERNQHQEEKARRVAEKRRQIQMQIERAIWQSPMLEIAHTKGKRKGQLDKAHLQLPLPDTPKPVRLQIFKTDELHVKPSADQPPDAEPAKFNISTFTSQVRSKN